MDARATQDKVFESVAELFSPLTCEVNAEVERNTEGRIRVLKMRAELRLGVPAAQLQHLDRVLEQFEAYCTVTQSVGQGIAIETHVWDSAGQRLK